MTTEIERPWMVYKKKDGRVDKLFQPGWAGQLGQDELERLQQALLADADLSRVWGWRPAMERRATVASERVAYNGAPDDIAHNRKLVREFSRKPKEDNEGDSPKVKQSITPPPGRPGRPRIETWESELLRIASSGMELRPLPRL
jgi:hypothetical protein